jgi:hypothetical protein
MFAKITHLRLDLGIVVDPNPRFHDIPAQMKSEMEKHRHWIMEVVAQMPDLGSVGVEVYFRAEDRVVFESEGLCGFISNEHLFTGLPHFYTCRVYCQSNKYEPPGENPVAVYSKQSGSMQRTKRIS